MSHDPELAVHCDCLQEELDRAQMFVDGTMDDELAKLRKQLQAAENAERRWRRKWQTSQNELLNLRRKVTDGPEV